MAQNIQVCRSSSGLLQEIETRLGTAGARKFISLVQERGKAWAYYGMFADDGKPYPMVFQACRIDNGQFAIRDCSYSVKEPAWLWVADVRKMVLPPTKTFHSGKELQQKSGSANIPTYARPDVPSEG